MESTGIDESRLRDPRERRVFVLTAALNLLLFAAALALITFGPEWLTNHPTIARLARDARAAAVALLLAPPALVFLRNTRLATMRGSSVRVGPAQLPVMHVAFERLCAALGVSPPPELYVSEGAIGRWSDAYSAWGRRCVVLNAKLLQPDLEQIADVWEFFLARELGRIRLGHTGWWDELLVSYVVRIPYLRNPLMHVRTYTHDRCALAAAPGSVRGLVVQASGRLLLPRVDVRQYVREAIALSGRWYLVANRKNQFPHVTFRVRQLAEAGFLDGYGAGESAGVAAPASVPGVAAGAQVTTRTREVGR